MNYDAKCSFCGSEQSEPEGTTSITCQKCGRVTNNIDAPRLTPPPKWNAETEKWEDDDDGSGS